MENLTQTTPKPRTEAQIAAARANGAKSHGPTSEEGKSRSAQNSRRHGLLAKNAILPGESTESFLELSTSLYEAWQPQDEFECGLVDTMSLASWRRMRALAMESAAMAEDVLTRAGESGRPAGLTAAQDHFHSVVALSNRDGALDLIHRYEARFTRAYERAARTLIAYRAYRERLPQPEPPASVAPPAAQIPNPPHEPEPPKPPAPEQRSTPQNTPETTAPLPDQPPVPQMPRRSRQLKKWEKKMAKGSRGERRQ
jgi:hypothetical protein